MISHFMVAARSSTSAAGIKLPPVHGAQKGIDPALKSKQTLLKPNPITPGRKAANPAVVWSHSQTPISNKSREALPSTSKSTSIRLLNTPVQSQTILCEVSNFIVAVPMKTATIPEICNVLMDSFIGYFGTLIRIVCDQDPAFMSHLTQWF